MKFKPTSEQKKIIRACAAKSAGERRVEICASTRVSLITGKQHMNVAMISDEPDFEDTDLYDNAFKWSHFTRGVELTELGRGVFDFWVYSVGQDAELKTNVTVYVEAGYMVRVEGTCNGTMWSA